MFVFVAQCVGILFRWTGQLNVHCFDVWNIPNKFPKQPVRLEAILQWHWISHTPIACISSSEREAINKVDTKTKSEMQQNNGDNRLDVEEKKVKKSSPSTIDRELKQIETRQRNRRDGYDDTHTPTCYCHFGCTGAHTPAYRCNDRVITMCLYGRHTKT